jgi:hypothetical protein
MTLSRLNPYWLTLAFWAVLVGGCALCFGALSPDGDRDDTARILEALKRDRVVELNAGRFQVDGRQFRKPEWQKILNSYFSIVGAVPANGFPQHTAQGKPNHVTTIVVSGLKPGEAWLSFKSEEAGPQQFINVAIERDNEGPLFQDDKSAAFDVLRTGGRGFLLQGVGIATSRGVPNYIGLFKGKELPPAAGAAIDLYNRADVSIINTSVTGFETQVQLDKCEYTIHNYRGMNCGRGIVADGVVEGNISQVRIENALISGIDVSCANVSQASVEVGYESRVGYQELERLPARCVAMVDGKPAYIKEPTDTKGTAILGIPFILRGDGNSLTQWTPNINRPIDLPVAAFAPFRKPTKVSHLNVGLMSGWHKNQRAIYIGDDKPRQFAFQRGVQWNDEPTYAPDHPFVYGMFGGGFDPNKREGE